MTNASTQRLFLSPQTDIMGNWKWRIAHKDAVSLRPFLARLFSATGLLPSFPQLHTTLTFYGTSWCHNFINQMWLHCQIFSVFSWKRKNQKIGCRVRSQMFVPWKPSCLPPTKCWKISAASWLFLQGILRSVSCDCFDVFFLLKTLYLCCARHDKAGLL